MGRNTELTIEHVRKTVNHLRKAEVLAELNDPVFKKALRKELVNTFYNNGFSKERTHRRLAFVPPKTASYLESRYPGIFSDRKEFKRVFSKYPELRQCILVDINTI